jgi:hypothetical protein
VLTARRLDETGAHRQCRDGDRTFIEWDKDDIDALGLMKVDVLALGMLTCIRKALRPDARQGGDHRFRNVPQAKTRPSTTCCARATASACSRSKAGRRSTCCRAEAARASMIWSIQVAIVRPGPIQGDMVHPYLRRREGEEPVEYPSPPRIMIPMNCAICWAGLRRAAVPGTGDEACHRRGAISPDEANGLRRAMATFRNVGTIDPSVRGGRWSRAWSRAAMSATSPSAASEQIKGFGSYGFPESHAQSVRAAGLCFVVAQMPSSGGLCLRAAEQRSRWASMRRRRSCATRASMEVEGPISRKSMPPRPGSLPPTRSCTPSIPAHPLWMRAIAIPVMSGCCRNRGIFTEPARAKHAEELILQPAGDGYDRRL